MSYRINQNEGVHGKRVDENIRSNGRGTPYRTALLVCFILVETEFVKIINETISEAVDFKEMGCLRQSVGAPVRFLVPIVTDTDIRYGG